MRKKILAVMCLAAILVLLIPTKTDAYGAARFGYTHVGPAGIYHVGGAAVGGYGYGGAYHYGYGGAYHYGYGGAYGTAAAYGVRSATFGAVQSHVYNPYYYGAYGYNYIR